jgi:hypothetical protein
VLEFSFSGTFFDEEKNSLRRFNRRKGVTSPRFLRYSIGVTNHQRSSAAVPPDLFGPAKE